MPMENDALPKGAGQNWIKWFAVTLVIAIIRTFQSADSALIPAALTSLLNFASSDFKYS